MRILVFFLLFLLSENVWAVGNFRKPRFLYNTCNLRTSPFSLLDFYSGSCYKIGLECKVFRQYAITVEYGGYLPDFNKLVDIKGSLIEVGLRRYLDNNYDHNGAYLSLNYRYKEQSFGYHDDFRSAIPYSKDYKVKKYVNCVNLNVGVCSVSERGFVFDLYAGVGIRMKSVRSSLSLDELKNGEAFSRSPVLRLMVKPGSFILPNLSVGIRLGILLSSWNKYVDSRPKTQPKF